MVIQCNHFVANPPIFEIVGDPSPNPPISRRPCIRRRVDRRAPWFDAECRTARSECRRCERRYRRTRSIVNRRQWVDATHRRFRLYRSKKETYWTNRVVQDGRSPAHLWKSLSAIVGKDRDVTGATGHTADGFACFFNRKVDDIRADTAAAPPPVITDTAPSSLSSFRPVTVSEVRRIIMSSPVKSCSLDPWPTFLIRDYVDLLTPCDVYGQRFARSRSSARHPQTRHSVAASQKGWFRHGRHG